MSTSRCHCLNLEQHDGWFLEGEMSIILKHYFTNALLSMICKFSSRFPCHLNTVENCYSQHIAILRAIWIWRLVAPLMQLKVHHHDRLFIFWEGSHCRHLFFSMSYSVTPLCNLLDYRGGIWDLSTWTASQPTEWMGKLKDSEVFEMNTYNTTLHPAKSFYPFSVATVEGTAKSSNQPVDKNTDSSKKKPGSCPAPKFICARPLWYVYGWGKNEPLLHINCG